RVSRRVGTPMSVAMASGRDQRMDRAEGSGVPHPHVMRSTRMASLQCSPQGSLVLWTWVTVGQQVGVSRGSHPGRTQRRTSPVGARV
ncbi:hypothetical protein KI387_010915, partial [Taxus chinensis]